ncbi:craniofacial development protein 2-like [Melitaea cinxia]|uniref:craniofacial development protein 2-like n=1 Tax=Melitaea cinxia TaxID=113334 RepID=UPI001E272BDF|nr:craniofacial development protein 2-like [Melitaea cinxia]
MDKNMELLLLKIDEKLEKQAEKITHSVNINVMEILDEKLKTITEENNILKNKVSELERKLKSVDREKRKNNLVLFGLEETGKSEGELIDYIKELISDTGVCLDSHEINSINVKEDYSKEILEKRKQLQPQLEEEKKKGNIAYIKYDKLIVLNPKNNNREKRKRETSDSPKSSALKKTTKHQTVTFQKTYDCIGKSEKFPQRLVPAGSIDHYPLTARRHKTLNIATLNSRTLRTEESLHELEKALEDINWDILGISEMRRLGEKIEERTDYILFQKGEVPGQGVGFIIKQSLKQQIHELIGLSDRIAILNIVIPGYKKLWTIIQCYSPTEQASKIESQLFYHELSKTITRYSNNHIILMGDFNAQVGAKQCKEEYVLGNYGQGKRSAHGEVLVEFLLQHNLTLLNSMYKKNQKNRWTWISPDGSTKNEIEYITTNYPKAFTDTSVIAKFNFNTNHRMVRSKINIEPPKKSRKYFSPCNIKHHSKETIKKIKQSLIQSTEELTTSNTDTNVKYGKLENILTNVKVKQIRAKKVNINLVIQPYNS